MTALPTPTMPHHPSANDGRLPRTLERLRGRWRCSVIGAGSGVTASGTLELLHAGSYLVGTARPAGPPVPLGGTEQAGRGATLEGSVFGAVRGEEIIFWLTNRSGSAVWVLQGRLDPQGAKITGSASYTDAERASAPPWEGAFTLALL